MAFSNPLTFATIVQAYEFELYDTNGDLVAELAPMAATPSWFAGIGLAMLHGNPTVEDSALRWTRKGTGVEQVVLAGPAPDGDSVGTAVELEYNPSTDFYSAQMRSVDLDGPASAIVQTVVSSPADIGAGMVAFDAGGSSSMGVNVTGGAAQASIVIDDPTTRTWLFDNAGRLWLPDGTGTGLTADGTNIWRLSGSNLYGPGLYGALSTRDEASTGPSWQTGMIMRGLGWAFLSDYFGSYRMGYRGNASGTGYAWCADALILGSSPNDSLNTHTLRAVGTGYFSGRLDSAAEIVAGGLLVGNAGLSTTFGAFSNQVRPAEAYNAGSDWTTASLRIGPGGSVTSIAMWASGVAPQFRVGSGVNIVYLRNSNDSGYATLEGILTNMSSRTLKQDIKPWRGDALVTIAQLQPVTYRWKRDAHLDQIPTGRRGKALARLNSYTARAGLPAYDGPELRHECGRDCDGSEAEPCTRVRDWQEGQLGLIAEDTGEVMPELAHVGPDGTYTGLDAIAVATLALAGIREIAATLDTFGKRLAALESR